MQTRIEHPEPSPPAPPLPPSPEAAPGIIAALVELVRRASTDLPEDVESALRRAHDRESPKSAARSCLEAILENVALARARVTPICQDTGVPTFYVRKSVAYPAGLLRANIAEAVAQGTRKSYLRPNAVAPLTGKNSGDNVGEEFPVVYVEEVPPGEPLRVDLILKGGGSENVSGQYSLPDESLGAGRDLEGVRRVLLHAVHKAQGLGCAPGILGIGIGGDRGTSFSVAKRQLLRPLDVPHPDPEIRALEERLLREVNELGIGPMGFGGATTVLGVRIGTAARVPASFFVSLSYMCWACRRRSLTLEEDGWRVT